MMFPVGRLEMWKQSVVVAMLGELLQCTSFYHFGYEEQIAYWCVI